MTKGRWSHSEEQVAIEAYSVLMRREKAGRSLSKADLKATLKIASVYKDFLKLCLENDSTNDLDHFRRGLLKVVKAVGVTKISEKIGLSRLGLYRMLSKGGNPRLNSILALYKALGIHMWVVDDDFKRARERVVRPKDIVATQGRARILRRPGHFLKSL
jgi:probable addiction module antidote protein